MAVGHEVHSAAATTTPTSQSLTTYALVCLSPLVLPGARSVEPRKAGGVSRRHSVGGSPPRVGERPPLPFGGRLRTVSSSKLQDTSHRDDSGDQGSYRPRDVHSPFH